MNAVAFFDPAHGRHAIARSGLTLLFDGSTTEAVPEGAEIEASGAGVTATLAGRFELSLEPLSEALLVGGTRLQPAAVSGTMAGGRIDCMGLIGETDEPPRWAELDVIRSVAVVFDELHALVLEARRPRGAVGHETETVVAVLLEDGEAHPVEDARLSTVYDGEGRQRSAGLELWLEDEDFPRRASGAAAAGTTLELPGLVAHASIFEWQMDEHRAHGLYEITTREIEPTAA
ncbi:MAG: hypothetical protein H0U42_05890 [Thermoleophilaceae bacterium]|nr:hypothetical protein [Thermoleophilaceae bacterium]